MTSWHEERQVSLPVLFKFSSCECSSLLIWIDSAQFGLNLAAHSYIKHLLDAENGTLIMLTFCNFTVVRIFLRCTWCVGMIYVWTLEVLLRLLSLGGHSSSQHYHWFNDNNGKDHSSDLEPNECLWCCYHKKFLGRMPLLLRFWRSNKVLMFVLIVRTKVAEFLPSSLKIDLQR